MTYGPEVTGGLRLARSLAAVLENVPNYLDSGNPPGSEPERMLVQLVYQVNRQNYMSLLATIESDHVVPAAMLARSLMEESIRWQWMTNEPERMTALFHSLRRSVRLINEECDRLGVDAAPFVEPSPYFQAPPASAPAGSPDIAFPPVDQMLDDTDAILRSAGIAWQVRDALYGQYRVLSQLAHTNVLGMMAVVQTSSEADVSIGQKLSEPVASLVIHSAAASMTVIASHTVPAFVDDTFSHENASDLIHRAMAIADEITGLLAPLHLLTP